MKLTTTTKGHITPSHNQTPKSLLQAKRIGEGVALLIAKRPSSPNHIN